MLTLLVLVAALVACVAGQRGGGAGSQHWKHGPTFGWRTSRSKSYIIEAETTLHPGLPPAGKLPRLALWPGLDTKDGLVQPIIVSTKKEEYAKCKTTETQWCVFASYLKYPLTQKMGNQVVMEGTDALTMKFKYNKTVGGYEQWLYLKGSMVSYVASPTGMSKSFYTDVECQQDHVGVVKAHNYTETKITLSEADPQWGLNPSNHAMACADKISTPDGGKTWIVPTIRVSESVALRDYTNSGAVKPGPVICAGR
ncbi:hypothetical protein EJ06DRAFT_523515 [Trichodelitschia bisporula]|uniref:Concanavalin A-like lectin/glucanase n=1 Tax=Trichodelitschia bisporula TaxID=703511 RepID=A0A6G1HQP6_9PEZI|nr:hypothetical protein EJ06DRAFT_523515 [Trichodelitschia bisporula]